MKKINLNRMENSQEQTFNFDLSEMNASIESGVMNMPRGLTGQERREWVLKRLKEKGVIFVHRGAYESTRLDITAVWVEE